MLSTKFVAVYDVDIFLYLFFSDDNIEVGAQLYEIDTEAEATVVASTEATETKTETTTTPEPESTEASTSESTVVVPEHTRKPLIQFLGKSGWAKRLAGIEESAAPAAPSSPTDVVTVHGEIHPMYGRPRFTEKEMEALIMGGAETAPSVVTPSSGAKFAV
jgi:hypothetical protein